MNPGWCSILFFLRSATYVVVAAFLGSIPARGQENVIRFDHLSADDGLSEGLVTRIIQDRQSFMWFGTQDGLNRYDGHTFVVFRTDQADTNSLADSYVSALFEDSRGTLWIGTNGGGIDRYNRESGTFAHFGGLLSGGTPSEKVPVSSIAEDSVHQLWIGRVGGGLSRLDPLTGICRNFKHDSADTCSLSNDDVWSLHIDRTGVLWVGTRDGLNTYDPGRDHFMCYQIGPDRHRSVPTSFIDITEDASGTLLCSAWGKGLYALDRQQMMLVRWQSPAWSDLSPVNMKIWCMAAERSGSLWIGTYSSGLLKHDGKTTKQFVHEQDNANSLSTNEVTSLCIDRTGNLWVGTDGGGVNKYSSGYRGFAHYRHFASNPNTLGGENVWGIIEDRQGDLWVSMDGAGLDRFELKTNHVAHYRTGLRGSEGLTSDKIVALCEDRDGFIWSGTRDAGLFRLDKKTGRFTQFKFIRDDPATVGADVVNSIYEDSGGTLWIGTYYGGLSTFDKRTGRFTRHHHDAGNARSLGDNTVYPILESRRGGMWIGLLGGGLDRFNNGEFTHYRSDPLNPKSLSNDRVLSLFEDRSGFLWVGTMGGGLNRLDPESGMFMRFTEKEGLPNSTIYGILDDDKGNLWLSTNKGIAKFDALRWTVRSYDVHDGLQANEFTAGACLKTRAGEMLFGGFNGFNRFHPDSVRDNKSMPPVVLTSFAVLGAPARRYGDLLCLPEIRLSHNENFFSFEFAALDYTNPSRNEYAYMIEGFDKDWVRSGSGHTATYTNVEPGEYVFRVAGSNNDGVWNWEGAKIKVTIVPPPWKAWWAYALYGVLAIAGVFTYVRAKTGRQKRALAEQKKKLDEQDRQLERERLVSDSLRRADEQISASLKEKEVLLKEIHHRVKNNMQVISSLLNLQAHQIEDEEIRNLFKESRDRVRSMALIHEKLYRSASLSLVDFSVYTRDLTLQLCRTYSIENITVDMEMDSVSLTVDKAIPCGLIINELVTNSLKYAFPHGVRGDAPPVICVGLHSTPDKGYILSVRDNGVGLPEGFDIHRPTSLGLQLVNTLAEQLRGTLSVEHGKGTCVKVAFT